MFQLNHKSTNIKETNNASDIIKIKNCPSKDTARKKERKAIYKDTTAQYFAYK